MRTVHANYVRGAFRSDEASPPERVVSFFSMSGPVELAEQQPICGAERNYAHPQRNYYVAHTGDNVTVVKWDEAQTSLAACSCIPQDELVRLVDSTEVAAAPEQQTPALGESLPLGGARGGEYAPALLFCGLLAVLLGGRLVN